MSTPEWLKKQVEAIRANETIYKGAVGKGLSLPENSLPSIPEDQLPIKQEDLDVSHRSTEIHRKFGGRNKTIKTITVRRGDGTIVAIPDTPTIPIQEIKRIAPENVFKNHVNAAKRQRNRIKRKHG